MKYDLCQLCGKVPPSSERAKYCGPCRRQMLTKQLMEHTEKRRIQNSYGHAIPNRDGLIRCKGCKYWKFLKFLSGADYCCHYFFDTGNLRKIPARECYKQEGTPYTKKEKRNAGK